MRERVEFLVLLVWLIIIIWALGSIPVIAIWPWCY